MTSKYKVWAQVPCALAFTAYIMAAINALSPVLLIAELCFAFFAYLAASVIWMLIVLGLHMRPDNLEEVLEEIRDRDRTPDKILKEIRDRYRTSDKVLRSPIRTSDKVLRSPIRTPDEILDIVRDRFR